MLKGEHNGSVSMQRKDSRYSSRTFMTNKHRMRTNSGLVPRWLDGWRPSLL